MARIRTALLVTGAVAMLLPLLAGVASADPSPNGPGQPGAPNTTCSQYTSTPGHSNNSNSPFNSNGQSGTVYAGNPGTASLNHSASNKSVSQYDMACFQATSH